MIRLFQKVSVFSITKFEAAVKAMKDCGNEPWIEKVSKEQKLLLEKLYKQATREISTTQAQSTAPNFDSPMNSFRSQIGKETVQGATQPEVHRHFFKPKDKDKSDTAQNKNFFEKNSQSPEDAGKNQTEATQSLAKGKTVKIMHEPKPKINEDKMESSAQQISKEGYGNRTHFKSDQNKNQERPKEQAQKEYIDLAKSILQKHKGEKYVNDF